MDHGHSHNHGADGHSHPHSHQSHLHDQHEEEEGEEEIVSSTLCELVPGAAIHNLLVRVAAVKNAGEATVETAHGSCTLMFDAEKLGFIIKEKRTLRIVDGFGWTEESGRLVLRLEDPEENSVVVESGVDEDDVTPPSDCGQNDLSSVSRLYGLLVIREDRCLLCPAGLTAGKFTFPLSEADGDEPERTAALRAFQSITEIDVNEVYILNDLPPVIAYEEDQFLSVLFVAYSRRPFKKQPQIPTAEDAYGWFTFDQAVEALETEGSKSCLVRAQQALTAAIQARYVRGCFGATFGPSSPSAAQNLVEIPPLTAAVVGVPQPTKSKDDSVVNEQMTKVSSPTSDSKTTSPVPVATTTISQMLPQSQTTRSVNGSNTEALLARTSALFYLMETGAIPTTEFDRLLRASPSPLIDSSWASLSKTTTRNTTTGAITTNKPFQVVPVTVLTGFLGAGKTTLVNHVLSKNHGMKIALVVNDFSEVNVDARLIGKHAPEGDVVEMSNGCICCSLREDLLDRVYELAMEQRYDCILIESTGIGEPLSIAETFTFEVEEDGKKRGILNDFARLDTVVTVVDASSLLKDMNLTLGSDDDQEKEPQLATLLTEQIEFANVIVLNKLDLVNVSDMTKVRAVVSSINPKAKKIECVQGTVALEEVIDTKLFSFDEAQQSPMWLQTLRGEKVPESLEYGIGSVVWRVKQPISPSKLAQCLRSPPFNDMIIRSKGIVWLATELGSKSSVEWAGAGHQYQFYIGRDWPNMNEGQSEVVLIGFFQDKTISERAMKMLDECLLPVGQVESEGDESIKVITEVNDQKLCEASS